MLVNFLRNIPEIDLDHVYIMGYSLGGNVALHAAALDDRVSGVAAFAAFTPFASDTAGKPTGGLRRLAEMHALLPRLGRYIGSESDVPYVSRHATLQLLAMYTQDALALDGSSLTVAVLSSCSSLCAHLLSPQDYEELLSAIAPRPTLLYTPTEDRDANHGSVVSCITAAKKAWVAKGKGDALTHTAPESITQMTYTEADAAVAWAKAQVAGGR